MNTRITDHGLEHLRQMENLRLLWLTRTDVIAEGVARLQQALPDCVIFHQSLDGAVSETEAANGPEPDSAQAE